MATPTLYSVLVELYNHNCKSEIAQFEITVPGLSRVCHVSKIWVEKLGEWRYRICEQYNNLPSKNNRQNAVTPDDYLTSAHYTEAQFIGALARVCGVELHFGYIQSVVSPLTTKPNPTFSEQK